MNYQELIVIIVFFLAPKNFLSDLPPRQRSFGVKIYSWMENRKSSHYHYHHQHNYVNNGNANGNIGMKICK